MNYPYKENTFTFESQKIVYIDGGEGTPLIFLHGQASDLMNFEPVYSMFARDFRIIALDYPGYGKSGKVGVVLTEDSLVRLLEQLYKVTQIQSATLIGHSFGGYVAMLFALANPGMVQSMILVSPAGLQEYTPAVQQYLRSSFTVAEIVKTSVEKAYQNYRASSVYWSPQMEKYAQYRIELLKKGGDDYQEYARAMVQAMELMLNTKIRERIGSIHIPTLLVWGNQDPLIPLTVGKEAKRIIQNSRLKTIDRCGHFPMLEYPNQFHRIIQTFLAVQI
ncbi:MAG: alpha/beta fold hydrolase [Fidelibacterota bacterium]